jgi:dienelactone hydrolase
MPDPMEGIETMERPPDARWPWPVHRTGQRDRPPVIVMHELHGVSPAYTAFCRGLAANGFSVWMPQLAGPAPSVSRVDRARAMGAVCISREIDVLRGGRTSPVVEPLRAVAKHVAKEFGWGRVGVVGMCMSGGFALAMAVDPTVVAAVAAQPTLPLRPFCGRALGLSGDDVRTISERLATEDVEIYYTRFARDPLSPRSRRARTVSRLGQNGVEVDELPAAEFRLLEHSVLTGAPEHYGESGPQAVRLAETAQRVSSFLHRRLEERVDDSADDVRPR